MAKENVKKFYEAITQDEAWQQKLAELSQKYQGETMNEEKRTQMVNDDILPLAAQMGIPFTLEELKQYETDMKQTNGNSELSDDELEAVAGGGGITIFVFLWEWTKIPIKENLRTVFSWGLNRICLCKKLPNLHIYVPGAVADRTFIPFDNHRLFYR